MKKQKKEFAHPPIPNGCCKTRTGFRQLLLSSNNKVKEVLYQVHRGYQPDRCTVQVSPSTGDLLYGCSWGHGSDPDGDYSIQRFNGSTFIDVPLVDQGPLWAAAQSAVPWMEEFVAPHPRGSSFIPFEGDTILEAAKRRRLNDFFKYWNLPFEANSEFMTSPGKGLGLFPVKMERKDIIPESYSWDGSVVSISRYEKWFVVSRDRKITVEMEIHPAITSGSNYAHSGPTFEKEGRPLEIPKGAGWMIRVGFGQYTHEHVSWGRTITIYDVRHLS